MPTTTWQTLRREIARPWLITVDTTTAIGASNIIVSTYLQRRFNNDDALNGRFATIVVQTDGVAPVNGLGTETRRITDYTASSGTLTLATPNLQSEGSDQVEVDIYRYFHPDDIKRAFNRVRQIPELYPRIALIRDIDTVVTGESQYTFKIPSTIRDISAIYMGQLIDAESSGGNLLLNGGFETWTSSTAAENWTLVGSGASVNQEELTGEPENHNVLLGNNSARIAVPLNTLTTLLQTFDPSDSSYTAVATEGVEINVSAWVYCLTASRVSVRIATDIDSASDGTAHGGTGWERITHTVNAAAAAATVDAGIVASSGAVLAVYVDNVILTLGPSEGLDLPDEPLANWDYVPPVAGASDGGTIRFPWRLPPRRRIRIVGRDLLSSVSVDTSTIEIDGEYLEPVYNKVREFLCDERAQGDAGSTFYRQARDYQAAFEDEIRTSRVRNPAKIHHVALL